MQEGNGCISRTFHRLEGDKNAMLPKVDAYSLGKPSGKHGHIISSEMLGGVCEDAFVATSIRSGRMVEEPSIVVDHY